MDRSHKGSWESDIIGRNEGARDPPPCLTWIEKKVVRKIVKKCSDIFARLRGFLYFLLFTIFSQFFSQPFFRFMPGMRRVTCSFVATNDVTFPWSFVRPIHSLPIDIPDLCDSRALVFPRLICRFIFKG